MSRLRWWFVAVGIFYVLLSIMTLPFVSGSVLGSTYPDLAAETGSLAVTLLREIYFMFGLDMLVIGIFLLFASRDPLRYIPVAWLVIALEIVRGVLDDIYMIARGYPAAGYIAFIAIHLLIILTGVWAIRSAQASGRTAQAVAPA